MPTKTDKLKSLLKTLSKDPKIAAALSAMKSDGSHKVHGIKHLFINVIRVSAKFLGKRKARTLEDILDVVTIVVQLSLILKENVFDRPEVKAFFASQWVGLKTQTSAILETSRKFVNTALEKAQEARKRRASKDSGTLTH